MKNLNRENRQNPLHTISKKTRLFTDKFSRTTTIHPGIFRGRALWADSVSTRMNTIASRDQFQPVRLEENLVVNYIMADSVQWLSQSDYSICISILVEFY